MDFEHLPAHLRFLAERVERCVHVHPCRGVDGTVCRIFRMEQGRGTRPTHRFRINNQQRFARALIADELHFPSYPQIDMVRVQKYGEAPVELLTGSGRS